MSEPPIEAPPVEALPEVQPLMYLTGRERRDIAIADGLVEQAHCQFDMLKLARDTMWTNIAKRYQLPPGFRYDATTGLLYLRSVSSAEFPESPFAADEPTPMAAMDVAQGQESRGAETATGAAVDQSPVAATPVVTKKDPPKTGKRKKRR